MTNISIEDLSQVKKRVSFEIPQEKVQEVIDEQYRDLKKNVQLKGFRRGKAPMSVLKGMFKDRVKAEAARIIIEDTLESGLDEKEIKPVAVTKIDPEDVVEGLPFKFVAELEVSPKLEIKDFNGLKLTKYIREVTDEMVSKQLEELRQRHSRLAPIPESRGTTSGDNVLVDIGAFVEGNESRVLSVSDYHMTLGRDFYLEGFDSHLEGMKPEETKEINLTLPEDFAHKSIAGKPATFNVTLLEAKATVLPELDDDLAKDVGDFASLDDLREDIRKTLREQADEASRSELERQVVENLVQSNPFDVPDSMVDRQIDALYRQLGLRLAMQGIDASRIGAPSQAFRDQARPEAEHMVKAGLIVDSLSQQQNVEVSDEDVEKEIQARAARLEIPVDSMRSFLENESRLDDLRFQLMERKTFDLILASAEITEQAAPAEGSVTETTEKPAEETAEKPQGEE